jgi:predicted transposase/invertase (TIGR01784 family)
MFDGRMIRSMSTSIINPHDAFFRQFMSKPELARTFLREHLPPQVAELLAPELPEQVPGSYVDEELAQHHSDLVFRVRLQDGDPALAYVLLEHKSSSDPATRLQLLRYVVRILAKWHRENDQLPLPVVVPLVAHHGPWGWKCSTEFIDLFGNVPDPLRPYLTSFRHALVDLATVDDSALSTDIRLDAYLKAMKYAQRADLPQQLRVILVPELTDMDIVAILQYINAGPVAVGLEAIQAALQSVNHSRREAIMGHFSEPFVAQGLEQGRRQGRQQGRADGLVRLLEKRFGPIPSSLHDRIFGSDVVTIDTWFDRAVEARELLSVFEPKGTA